MEPSSAYCLGRRSGGATKDCLQQPSRTKHRNVGKENSDLESGPGWDPLHYPWRWLSQRKWSSQGQNCCEASAGLGSKSPPRLSWRAVGRLGRLQFPSCPVALTTSNSYSAHPASRQGQTHLCKLPQAGKQKWMFYNTGFLQAHSLPQDSAGRNAEFRAYKLGNPQLTNGCTGTLFNDECSWQSALFMPLFSTMWQLAFYCCCTHAAPLI